MLMSVPKDVAFKVRKVDNFSAKKEVGAKSIRQIRIRYSDLKAAERQDPFMRYKIILCNLGKLRIGGTWLKMKYMSRNYS